MHGVKPPGPALPRGHTLLVEGLLVADAAGELVALALWVVVAVALCVVEPVEEAVSLAVDEPVAVADAVGVGFGK